MTTWQLLLQALTGHKHLPENACKRCEKIFKRKQWNQKYCSDVCANEVRNAVRRQN